MRIKTDPVQDYVAFRARGMTHAEAENALADIELIVEMFNAGELDPEVMEIIAEHKPKVH